MPDGIEFRQCEGTERLLTPAALEFVADLHRRFDPRRQELLAERDTRQAAIEQGQRPRFRADTAHIRNAKWTVAAAPADLIDRRSELTGPVDRRTIVDFLNSGALVFMADFEDAFAPTWEGVVAGQVNLIDAFDRSITYIDDDGSEIGLVDSPSTMMVRARGWHLDEPGLMIDGHPISASLLDFGLCLFHNWSEAINRGSGPYFYLAKLEGMLEARLWNEVFDHSESMLGITPGTIRATVLIEHVLAAFEMDEILYELRTHATGLHTGNWDYLFSINKVFRSSPEFVLPDRDAIKVTTPFMRAFTELLVSTCHRRGAHAIGGMSGVMPDPDEPERTATALRKVTVDKRREAGDGFDGTRIANPELVSVAVTEFDKVLGEKPNQVARQRDDVYVTAGDLLSIRSLRGAVTENGVRTNACIAITYIADWLGGNGSVLINNHTEDTAMAELCRSQLWTWVHHEVETTGGVVLTREHVAKVIDEELAVLMEGADDESAGRLRRAAKIVCDVSLDEPFLDFWTHHPSLLG